MLEMGEDEGCAGDVADFANDVVRNLTIMGGA
jgi:hypothetical protein